MPSLSSRNRHSSPASRALVISGLRSVPGAASAALMPPPAVTCDLGLVMNMGMSFPTRLHVRRTLANEIHRGSSNILPITHDAPAE